MASPYGIVSAHGRRGAKKLLVEPPTAALNLWCSARSLIRRPSLSRGPKIVCQPLPHAAQIR